MTMEPPATDPPRKRRHSGYHTVCFFLCFYLGIIFMQFGAMKLGGFGAVYLITGFILMWTITFWDQIFPGIER